MNTSNQLIVQATFQLATAENYRVLQQRNRKNNIIWVLAKEGECRQFRSFEEMSDHLRVGELMDLIARKSITVDFLEVDEEWVWQATHQGHTESFEDIRDLRHHCLMLGLEVPTIEKQEKAKPSFVRIHWQTPSAQLKALLALYRSKADDAFDEDDKIDPSYWKLHRAQGYPRTAFPTVDECRRSSRKLAEQEEEKKRQRLEERDRLIRWYQQRVDVLGGVHVG